MRKTTQGNSKGSSSADRRRKSSVSHSSSTTNSTDVKKVLKIIGTTLLCTLLVLIITGTIVVTALTVYVLKFMDSSSSIDLDNTPYGFSTHIYADGEKENEYVEIGSISDGRKRIWVDLDKIPVNVQSAFISSEDTRFFDHQGVDFKRTFGAFANMLVPIYSSRQGGSTITQQVVKNITGDDGKNVSRKLREMFSALNLEKNYTKEDILEAYLNIIYFSSNCYGIQTASNFYFNKDVSQLTIQEAACLAAMTKSPNSNNPIKFPENNKVRRDYILKTMLDNGAIDTEEYNTAVSSELKLVGYNKVDDGNNTKTQTGVTSYFYDAAVNQAIDILAEKLDISKDKAEEKFKTGGYKVYTTQNVNIQKELDEKYTNYKNFAYKEPKDAPECTTVMMDYKGNIVGLVGGYSAKTSSRSMIRTEMPRPPGSTIKPIASYGPAIMLDKINWSTRFFDDGVEVYDYSQGKTVKKPMNYDGYWSYKWFSVDYFLKRSLNTAPAQIIHNIIGEKTSYDFLVNKLHMSHLVKEDCNMSPLSVGSFTHGITLTELTASYQMFGNEGKYYAPTYIKKITDSEGKLVYEHKYKAEQPMDPDSAYVMNRLMNLVINDPKGTGYEAGRGIKNVNVVGKTGSSDNLQDITMVGLTPEYVSGLWYGYDSGNKSTGNVFYSSAKIWNNLYKDIINKYCTVKDFKPSANVVQKEYCVDSGLLAGPDCTNTAMGYYKKSNLPKQCNGTSDHENAQKKPNE